MRDNLKRIVLTAAGVAALTGGTIAVTDTAVAKPKHKHAKKHKAGKKRNANQPAALTGDTKTQAEAAAANAVPGGTVEHSHTARPGNPDNAAYAVDVKKSDGSEVVVLEDASFNVVNIVDRPDGPRGDGPGGGHPCHGPGGPGGPGAGDQQQPQQQGQGDNT